MRRNNVILALIFCSFLTGCDVMNRIQMMMQQMKADLSAEAQKFKSEMAEQITQLTNQISKGIDEKSEKMMDGLMNKIRMGLMDPKLRGQMTGILGEAMHQGLGNVGDQVKALLNDPETGKQIFSRVDQLLNKSIGKLEGDAKGAISELIGTLKGGAGAGGIANSPGNGNGQVIGAQGDSTQPAKPKVSSNENPGGTTYSRTTRKFAGSNSASSLDPEDHFFAKVGSAQQVYRARVVNDQVIHLGNGN